MPYVIRKTDGSNFLIIQDGVVDTSTGMNLVGRSFTGYGNLLAENFVRLAENFANSTAPLNPLEGQLWYDTVAEGFKFWDGIEWKNISRRGDVGPVGPIGPIGYAGSRGDTGDPGPLGYTGSIGPSGPIGYAGSQGESSFTWGPIAPTFPKIGDRWFDTLTGAELVWVDDGNSSQWVEVSASGFVGTTGYTGSQGAPGAITVNADGGGPDSVYGGLPSIDGGVV